MKIQALKTILLLVIFFFNYSMYGQYYEKKKPKKYGEKIVKKDYEFEIATGIHIFLSKELKSATPSFNNELLFLKRYKHSFTYAAKTIFSYGLHLQHFYISNKLATIQTLLTGFAYSIFYYTPDFGSLFAVTRAYGGVSSNSFQSNITELTSVASGGLGAYLGLQYGLGGTVTESLDIKVLHRFYLLFYTDDVAWTQDILLAVNYKI